MVVKSQIKFIKNLQQKKYRNLHGLFVVEGVKVVQELLDSDFKVYKVFCTNDAILDVADDLLEIISENDLKKISSLKTPNKVLAVFYMPQPKKISELDWVLVLDDVRDPGNLGTIVRLCDWFGITDLVCSKQTVDCYNPKTLQATMGSITRVNIVYADIVEFLTSQPLPVYGAFMNGDKVYSENLPLKKGVLVMGNEANGISKEVEELIAKRISIPQFGNTSTESLNVATATAILLNEIRRSNS